MRGYLVTGMVGQRLPRVGETVQMSRILLLLDRVRLQRMGMKRLDHKNGAVITQSSAARGTWGSIPS